MTIFQVRRAITAKEPQSFSNEVLDAKKINEGFHKLVRKEGGLKTLEIPITVKGNSVTLHVQDARGRLDEVFFKRVGEWKSFNSGREQHLIKTVVDLEDGQSALYFLEQTGVVSLLERHEEKQIVFDRSRLK